MKNKWGDWFYYDETSPSFLRWKVARYSGRHNSILEVSAGDVAGHLDTNNYWKVKLKSVCYPVHRIIFEMFNGVIENGFQVDHLDGIRSNNIISNLRSVSKVINSRNKKVESRNSSGFVGVYKNSTPYYEYWTASWYCFLSSKQKSKAFNIQKLGSMSAYEAAVEYRISMMLQQNTLGAGYTNRHIYGDNYET